MCTKEWQPIVTQGPITREWLMRNFGGKKATGDNRALEALRNTFVANDQLFARRNGQPKEPISTKAPRETLAIVR